MASFNAPCSSRLRCLVFFIASTSLVATICWVVLCHSLPDDPHHVAGNLSLYFYFGASMSFLGCLAAIRQHSHHLSIFANFLFFDAVVQALPRLLVLIFGYEWAMNVCTTLRAAPSLESTIASPAPSIQMDAGMSAVFGQAWDMLLQISRTFSINVTDSAESINVPKTSEAKCVHAVYIAHVALAGGVFAFTTFQVVGALMVKRYSSMLLRQASWELELALHTKGNMNMEKSATKA